MTGSWRTTLCGLLALICTVLAGVALFVDPDPASRTQIAIACLTAGQVFAGFAGLLARDATPPRKGGPE